MENIPSEQKIGEYVKNSFDRLLSENFLSADDINNLKDSSFCKENFGTALNLPILETNKENLKDSKGSLRYWATPFESQFGKLYIINHWFETQREKFDSWIDSIYMRSEASLSLKISVGYAWQSDCAVSQDIYWKSLRDYLTTIKNSVERNLSNFKVEIRRIRASHGNFVFTDISSRIENSDILVFDVADTRNAIIVKNDKSTRIEYDRFNPNVMFEVGIAISKSKNPILMCPTCLKSKIPSDLSNYMWSFYDLMKLNDGEKYERVFEDRRGLTRIISGRLIVKAKELKIHSDAFKH